MGWFNVIQCVPQWKLALLALLMILIAFIAIHNYTKWMFYMDKANRLYDMYVGSNKKQSER